VFAACVLGVSQLGTIMGVRREVGQNGHLPPWKLGLRTKNFKKTRPKVYAADQKSADQIMLLTKSQQHNSD